jgi:hypothetical protein
MRESRRQCDRVNIEVSRDSYFSLSEELVMGNLFDSTTEIIGNAFELSLDQKKLLRVALIVGAGYVLSKFVLRVINK